MRLLAAAAAVLASTSALAQQAPGQVEPAAPAAQPAQPHKDPGTAVALSIGATTIGLLVFVDGARHDSSTAGLLGLTTMYVGPSLGVWYGGGTGAIGLTGRLAGFLMVMHGLSLDSESDYDCLDLTAAQCKALEQQYNQQQRDARLWAYGGLAVWGAATVYDFVDAHRSASRWNREHALTLAPMLAPHTTGMAVALRF
ncbi:MAG: hypothetical protein ACM31C_20225 [Acidobacteriota bacterium]